jgi:CarD family transcriptional regulator, regulator of rRNA transcription
MAARKKSTKKSEKTSSNKLEKTSSARSTKRRTKPSSSSASERKHGVKEKAAVKAPARKKVTVKAARRPATQKKRRKAGVVQASRTPKPAEKSVVRSGKTKPASPKTSANGRKAAGRSAKVVAEIKTVKSGHRQAETKVPLKTKTSKLPEISDASVSLAKPAKGGNVAAVSVASGAAPFAAAPPQTLKEPRAVPQEGAPLAAKAKPTGQRQGFKVHEFVVYPAHGVGQIVSIEEQEVAGFKLELFVINFSKDKMTLRVPTSKVTAVGMRKISDPEAAKRSLDILTGRARIKRTMWSRRAQEYETKINSGDINAIAEVVRDLYRSDAQPEQSYSERQLYEAALDRMVREIAAVQKSNEIEALKAVEAQLQKNHGRTKLADGPQSEAKDTEIEEAA